MWCSLLPKATSLIRRELFGRRDVLIREGLPVLYYYYYIEMWCHPLVYMSEKKRDDLTICLHNPKSYRLSCLPDCPLECHTYPTSLCRSLWHLDRALHRLGSGQRSRGDCPFLFFRFRSAPFAARNRAMDALDFLSAPDVPRPISN